MAESSSSLGSVSAAEEGEERSTPNRYSVGLLLNVVLIRFGKRLRKLKARWDKKPPKDEHEQRCELIRWLAETREQLVRVLVLYRWAKQAHQEKEIESFGADVEDEHRAMIDFAFRCLLQSVLPNVQTTQTVRFDIDTALETQVGGASGYSQLLPRFVTREFSPPVPTLSDQQRALRQLDERLRARVFEARLALLSAGYGNAELYGLGNGRACLRVRNEFVVTLTIMLDQKHEPWGVLRVQIMVRSGKDPIEGVMSSQQLHWLANSLDNRFRQPKWYVVSSTQSSSSRNTQVSDDNDNDSGSGSSGETARDMSTSNELVFVQDEAGENSPILQIYSMMHGFCLSLALDKLTRQAQSLAATSWQNVVQVVDDVPVNKHLSLVYWTKCVAAAVPSFASGPKTARYQRFPREHSVDVFIDSDNCLSVAHSPAPLVDPITGQTCSFVLPLNELDLEPLLEQAIQLNAYSKLEALRVFASSITEPQLLRLRPDAVHPDCLRLPLFPPDMDIALQVTIDKSTGFYVVELCTPYAPFVPRPTSLSRRLNTSFSQLESIFAELRFSSTVDRLVRLLAECGYQAFAERLPSPHFAYAAPEAAATAAATSAHSERFLQIFARSTVNFHCFVNIEVEDVNVRCLSFIRASKPLPNPDPTVAAAATVPATVQAPSTTYEYDTVPLSADMTVREALTFCHDVLHKIMYLTTQVRLNTSLKEFKQLHPTAVEIEESPSFQSLKVSKVVLSNLQLDLTFTASADTWTVEAVEPAPRTTTVPFSGYMPTSSLERHARRSPLLTFNPAEGRWCIVFSSPVSPDSFRELWAFFTGLNNLLPLVGQWDRLVAAKSVLTTQFRPVWTSCSLTFIAIDQPTCRVTITAFPGHDSYEPKQTLSFFPQHPLHIQLENFFCRQNIAELLSAVHASLLPASAIADYFSRHLLSPPGQASLIPQGIRCIRLVLLGGYSFDFRFISHARLAIIDRTPMHDFSDFCTAHLLPLWSPAEDLGIRINRHDNSICFVMPTEFLDSVLERLYRFVGLSSFAASFKAPKIAAIIQATLGEISPSAIHVNSATQITTIRPLEASSAHYELSVIAGTQLKLSAKKPEQVFVNSEPHQLFDMLGAKPKPAQQAQGGETLSPDGIQILGEFCDRCITVHPFSPFHLAALLSLLLLPVPLLTRLLPVIKESAQPTPRFHLILSHPSGDPFLQMERETDSGKRRLTFSIQTSDETCQTKYVYSQSTDRFLLGQPPTSLDPATDLVLTILNERSSAASSSSRTSR